MTRHDTIKGAILALLTEDGSAWTPHEIHDWLVRNPEWCARPSPGTVKTYISDLHRHGALERTTQIDGQCRYRVRKGDSA